MNRQEANKKILEIVTSAVENNPDLRFIQILWKLGIIDSRDEKILDRFYEEPEETLKRICNHLTTPLPDDYEDLFD